MSNPTTIEFDGDEHTLIPFLIDWKKKPEWRREWKSGAARANDGSEDRYSMMESGLHSLSVLLSPITDQERDDMLRVMLSAKQSGFAGLPFWGMGTKVESISGANMGIAHNLWNWSPGDRVFASNLNRRSHNWQLLTVDAVGVEELDFVETVNHSDLILVWPVVLGMFDCGSLDVLNHAQIDLEVEVTQRLPFGYDDTQSS